DRPPEARWPFALIVVPTCTLLSASMEFAQLYFPPRVTALNDIVAESLGGLVGTAAWLVAGQYLTVRLRRWWSALGAEGEMGPLLPLYLLLLGAISLLPLDLTLSPADLYRKYKEGRVQLVPFVGGVGDLFERLQ